MNTSKDYLTTKNPDLLKKLRAYRMADEMCDAMDDFAIEFAVAEQLQIADDSTHAFDCDDCKHYPCSYNQQVKNNNLKMEYGNCGDHSERGTP